MNGFSSMRRNISKKIKMNSIFFIFIFILLVLYLNWDTLITNLVMIFTLKRGIISQNCFWWRLNDLMPDATGTEVYARLKSKGRFVRLNLLGQHIYLMTDIRDITQLLQLSPNPFGPGIFKQNFFSTFIPNNVGIAVNPDWKYKREYNDKVLETDKIHSFNEIFRGYIREIFVKTNPKTFEEFSEVTRSLTSKILFGTYEYNPILYKVFKQADSLISARFNVNTLDSKDLEEYRNYIRYELENPKPNTLLYLANMHHKMLPLDSVIDQIPHWVFPIAGLFSVHLPRLLVILANHPKELEKVKEEIHTKSFLRNDNYIRKCILELFRLNNAVNSTFRGLTEPFTFEGDTHVFEKGTQFVFFNNPVLRDLFESPNEFIPSRWNLELEESFVALMFNQGNQRCPGKELVISLITSALVIYLEINSYSIETNIKINPSFVPYILNPCTIEFT
jgi:cytochrome P450